MRALPRLRLVLFDAVHAPDAKAFRLGGRSISFVVAAAIVGLLTGGLGTTSAPRPDSNAAEPLSTPARQQSSCEGVGTTSVVTDTIRQCEQTQIKVSAEATCPICRAGVNVVAVMPYWVDDPRWMKSEYLKVLDSLSRLKEDERFTAPVRIGVVRFDHLARIGTTQRLTENIQEARNKAEAQTPAECMDDGSGACPCVAIIGSLSRAAPIAKNLVRDERKDAGLANGDETCDFAVLFVEGSQGMCGGYPMLPYAQQSIAAGRDLEREFGTMLTGCPSSIAANCYAARAIGGGGRFFFIPPTVGGMGSALTNQFDILKRERLLREVAIVQHLPVGLDYVADSANVAPTSITVTEAGTVLRWEWNRIGMAGPHDVDYRVEPSATGAFTVTGELVIGDEHNRDRKVVLPEAIVHVPEPCVPPATETPIPSETPTATDTPTDTPTPTPTDTPTPTATPTPVPPDLYLPLTLRERCDAERRAADVVLVLDASTSMREDAGGGTTKMAASLFAAKVFIGELQLAEGRDRAAIVSFNDEARVMQNLTQDRTALDAALDAIVLSPQTCLPCAVDVAESVLDHGAADGRLRTKTMILLTDGRSNPRPVAEAVARAALAKQHGILLFTIGIGQELDVDALQAMASQPPFFFRSPDASDLERIYVEIASLIPCPAFWPQRP
ncbi:MAG: vWA domain-containing protein [Ardenticatenales bacterium]